MAETTRSFGGEAWVRACGSGGCVETARRGDQVLVRDSKDPDGPALRFDTAEFQAFVAAVKAGQFDEVCA